MSELLFFFVHILNILLLPQAQLIEMLKMNKPILQLVIELNTYITNPTVAPTFKQLLSLQFNKLKAIKRALNWSRLLICCSSKNQISTLKRSLMNLILHTICPIASHFENASQLDKLIKYGQNKNTIFDINKDIDLISHIFRNNTINPNPIKNQIISSHKIPKSLKLQKKEKEEKEEEEDEEKEEEEEERTEKTTNKRKIKETNSNLNKKSKK